MVNSVADRYRDIAQGSNKDASDEYYTLYHAFVSCLIELIARALHGKTYKVIICPCDSQTSVFRELVNWSDKIGNPRIIYSFYPEKDWKDYFDMDYQVEYGCSAEDVCIFTNPPFKGLNPALRAIRCDYIVFGSNAVETKGVYIKDPNGFWYTKNNTNYSGDADRFSNIYSAVRTMFYSNRPFITAGKQYLNETSKNECVLFGKDKLTVISD